MEIDGSLLVMWGYRELGFTPPKAEVTGSNPVG